MSFFRYLNTTKQLTFDIDGDSGDNALAHMDMSLLLRAMVIESLLYAWIR